jgi:AraC-like DNA-binding protein
VSLFDPIIYAGLGNSALLVVASGWAARHDRRWAWLCALFALMLLTLTAIVVSHRTEGDIERAAVAVEQIGWFAGPLFYHYVRASIGYVVTLRQAIAHFALPAAVVAVGTALILLRGYEPLPELNVFFQLCYTAAAIVLFARRPERGDRSLPAFWIPLVLLGAMVGIHSGQLLRFSPWGSTFADAVPLAASLFVLLFVLGALLAARPSAKSRTAAYAKSSLEEERAAAIFEAARAAIGGGLYRRFDLSLGDVAQEIGVSVHHLSQAISAAGRTSFAELVARLRVEEAERLLLDSANRAVAVEPLGMEAGFRSRSAFYAAFRGRTGLSPADYRRRGLSSPAP